jgi:ribosome-binding protein aMBF1 (putative translation factor)
VSDAVPTALYRLFGDDDALLYIGISETFGRRWQEHARSQPWWPEVRRQSLDWHPDRQSAEDAEEKAVKDEHPRYNVTYNLGDSGTRSRPLEPRVHAILLRHGKLARKLRREHGISQADLAASMRAMDWPWHQSTVVRVERGERHMTAGEAFDLAGLYGMTFGEFVEMSHADAADSTLPGERGAA